MINVKKLLILVLLSNNFVSQQTSENKEIEANLYFCKLQILLNIKKKILV